MTRDNEPANIQDASAMSAHRSRGPEEIEQDIQNIRSRMDSVLDEIEYRLSPGQLSGGVAQVVRDVIDGRPTRLSRAIRSNPWPLALIGAGALWLAWNVSRTPELPGAETGAREGFKDGELISGQHARILLTGLVGACRQGAHGFRRADGLLGDAALSPRLDQIVSQLERTAAALEGELRNRNGTVEGGGPVHPAWYDLDRAIGGDRALGIAPDRRAIFGALEHGLDGTLELFRITLHENLPDDLRVIVGAHFHEIESMRHTIGALREAVA